MRPAYWLALATMVLGPGTAVVGLWMLFPPIAIFLAIVQLAFLTFFVTNVRRHLGSPKAASQPPRNPAEGETRYRKWRAQTILMPLAAAGMFPLALIYIEDQTAVFLRFGGIALSVLGGLTAQRLMLDEMCPEAQTSG